MAANAVASSSAAGGGAQAGPSSTSFPTLTHLDDVVSLATECNDSITLVSQRLLPALRKLCEANQGQGAELLLPLRTSGPDLLQLLAPHQHSLAYLFVLSTRATFALQNNSISGGLLNSIDSFAQCFHREQVLLAGNQVTELAKTICALESKANVDANWIYQVMLALFVRFTGDDRCNLTTLHSLFVNSCIRAGKIKCAYENAVVHRLVKADARITPLRPADAIEYFYRAGEVAVHWKDWPLAEEMFESCVTAPATAMHPRQIDSAKRRILVQLLLSGKTTPLPPFTSAAVARGVPRAVKTYTELAQKYASHSRAINEKELRKFVMTESNEAVFQEDQVLPLVLFLVEQHRARRIQGLKATFVRLSVKDVIELLELGDTASSPDTVHERVTKEVQQLIASGRLDAVLVDASPSPQLVFGGHRSSKQSAFSDLASIDRLNRQIAELAHCNASMERRERDIAESTAYVKRMQSGAALGRAGPIGSLGLMRPKAGYGPGRPGSVFDALDSGQTGPGATSGFLSTSQSGGVGSGEAMAEDDYTDEVFS
ncbi:unnamed protein product [Parajaminaea phylloscopi]